jgi:hypothetical protein
MGNRCRSLVHCSSSIQCSIRYEATRANAVNARHWHEEAQSAPPGERLEGILRAGLRQTIAARAYRVFLRSQIAELGLGRFLGRLRRALVRALASLFV